MFPSRMSDIFPAIARRSDRFCTKMSERFPRQRHDMFSLNSPGRFHLKRCGKKYPEKIIHPSRNHKFSTHYVEDIYCILYIVLKTL